MNKILITSLMPLISLFLTTTTFGEDTTDLSEKVYTQISQAPDPQGQFEIGQAVKLDRVQKENKDLLGQFEQSRFGEVIGFGPSDTLVLRMGIESTVGEMDLFVIERDQVVAKGAPYFDAQANRYEVGEYLASFVRLVYIFDNGEALATNISSSSTPGTYRLVDLKQFDRTEELNLTPTL